MNTQYTETKIDQTLLPEAQHLLASLIRFRGGAYKVGGDEFVLILPNHQTREALAFVERVRSAFELHPFNVEAKTETLTVSCGVALSPQHGENYNEVLQKANEAKQLAKKSRNMIVLASLSSQSNWPLPSSGLSLNAQRLAVFLNQKSSHGLELDPMVDPLTLVEALSVSEADLALAADELEEKGWVALNKTSGMGRAGFSDISPKPLLFFQTDPEIKGWNTNEDARELAVLLSSEDRDGAWLKLIDQNLSWGTRRLNPAACYLVLHEYAVATEAVGSHPYAFHYLRPTERTCRFGKQGETSKF